MVTTDVSQWDETICNMIACQHPPCWEAMRRIEKGHPRILLKNYNSLERHFPEIEDELPTLKIFDLPLNYSYRERIKPAESSISTISIKDSRNYSTSAGMIEAFVPPVSVLSSERNNFPGLNSRVESHTPHYTPISFTSLRQAEKVQVTDLSDLAAPRLGYHPAYGNLIVKWIPDIRHKLLRSERPPRRTRTPTQRMSVKDLALESLLSFKNSKETSYPNLQKRKRSNKIPTGGQPYLLHLRSHPKIPDGKSSNPTGEERKAVGLPAGKRKFFPKHLHLSPVAEVQRKDAVHLKNKKRVLPGSKEKAESPHIVQKVPGLYRFEPKVPVKERGIGRIQSQLQIALEGSGVSKHFVSPLAQPMDSTTLTFQTSGACDQRSDGERLLYKTYLLQEDPLQSSEKVRLPECSPRTLQVAVNRRKSSLKFVEYKSSTASLFMEGYGSSFHPISKSESKYKQYCKQIAIRKEAAGAQDGPSTDSGELWFRKAAQKSEEKLRSPNPPPPSPLISECSEDPS